MSSDIDKLKEIGAQKIYEQTHVPKDHVQAILHNSFEDLNKVQIIGFISILEREYKVDLSETRDSANKYFNELSDKEENEHKEIFVAIRDKKSNHTVIYVVVILLILSIALYFSLNNAFIIDEKVDNTLITNINKKIVKEEIVKEKNSSKVVALVKELNVTKIDTNKKDIEPVVNKVIVKEKPKQEKKIVKSLKIIPKSKIWMGYVEVANNKHYQKVFANSMELNATKDWILLFGHNQLDIEVNGKIVKLKKSIRYSYIDGKIKAVTLEEFKKLNKGSKW